ncbi:MAG: hypothetical protein GY861_02385 [bacterium]|nr:hypothetical protein [bacterium]
MRSTKKLSYCVLEKNEKGAKMPYSSTYFYTHEKAFEYCQGLKATVKGVYKIISREPMTLGALNIYGSQPFKVTCPVREMEQEFESPRHGFTFKVI